VHSYEGYMLRYRQRRSEIPLDSKVPGEIKVGWGTRQGVWGSGSGANFSAKGFFIFRENYPPEQVCKTLVPLETTADDFR
jgi:hypothetical protein